MHLRYCGLTSITIPNSMTSIGSNMFYECSSLTYVTIGTNVTSIDYSAFYGCSLPCVTIPASVTNIGYWAFYGCGIIRVYFIGNAPHGDGRFRRVRGKQQCPGMLLARNHGLGNNVWGGISVFACSGQCTGQAIVLVIVTTNPSQGGSVSGSGTYPFGTNCADFRKRQQRVDIHRLERRQYAEPAHHHGALI